MRPVSSELDEKIRGVIRYWGYQAGKLRQTFQVNEKGPGDYVTSVDYLLDQQLSTALTYFCPQDGVITEENFQSRSLFHSSLSRLWLIDPLDGTEDFIQGNHSYAVMVGLLQACQPIAGWVYSPAQDHMVWGGRDWGLFQTVGNHLPQPLPSVAPAPPTAGFCPVLIGHRDRANFGVAIARLIPEIQFYSLGSFGLKVLEVVQGRAGLYLYCNRRVKLWDTTGPIALALAAGLVCCDLEGQPLEFGAGAVDPDLLAHRQTIVVGWPDYVKALLPSLRQAILPLLEAV